MENEELKTLNCHFCKVEIKPKDHVIIDANNCVYCSDKHLFYDYGQEQMWRNYQRRTDKTISYLDLGLMDIRYCGDYNKSCLEYIKEVK